MSKSYKRERREAILAEWPVSKQLEAIIEALETPPRKDKLNALQAVIGNVKAKFPKPA